MDGVIILYGIGLITSLNSLLQVASLIRVGKLNSIVSRLDGVLLSYIESNNTRIEGCEGRVSRLEEHHMDGKT